MPQDSLAHVLARHTPALLAIPGVSGTGEGEENGKPVFLILVRKATTLKSCELVGNWLYGVAIAPPWRRRRQASAGGPGKGKGSRVYLYQG